MTKVVLIRHGRSTANAAGILAGRMPGVALDDVGRAQALGLRALFGGVPVAAAYTSPVDRCRETAELAGFPEATVHDGLTECDYGEWTGARLESLTAEALWADIQAVPSRVTFPGGETMLDMFRRSTAAVAAVARRHAADDIVVVFSHGDPIKAVLAEACGMHLDDFQRFQVAPASVSIVHYLGERPMVVCINAGGDPAGLLAPTTVTPGGGDVPTTAPARG